MRSLFVFLALFLSLPAIAQSKPAPRMPAQSQPRTAQPSRPAHKPTAAKLTKEQQFVLQVVRSAVSLSQPDEQDRLRVLDSAASVASTVAPKYAAQLTKEGLAIEARLIANGQTPPVSVMSTGRADCAATREFVEQIDARAILAAEESLIGAISNCPKATLDAVRQKTDLALEQGLIAPRLLMVLMEKTGPSTPWTQQRFEKLFSSLPDPDSETSKRAAPDYAAMYSSMAPKIGADLARSTGQKLFAWLAKMEASPQRSAAVNITGSTLEQVLGKKKYQEFLEGDVIIRQLVEEKGPPPDVTPPPEESASVLQAMGGSGAEQQQNLRELPPSLRAREAAAHGFARGTAKDRDSANIFFDMAFSAAEEAWSDRSSVKDAPAIIEEVAEAAAHVDALDALRRAQALSDPTAQAIGMIAVARVVAGRDTR